MTGTERPRPRVVVVGSYAVGLVMRTARIPVRGETVLGEDFLAMDGGKGSNQAIACARLGAHTTFLVAVGDDSYGHAALELFRREDLDTSFVHSMPDVPTGTGFILVDPQGDNAIAVDLGANRLLLRDHVDEAEQEIAEADVVLAQLEIPWQTALHAMAVAKRHGVRAILNPAPAQPLPEAALSTVDIVTPNVTEAQILTGLTTTDPPALIDALRRAGAATVILTVGDQGAWIGDSQGPRRVPTVKVDAVDTTGAGDAFSAALAVALARGYALDEAVRYGCAAGAYSVCSVGTVPSYPAVTELATFLQLHRNMAPA
jgi:ribokinase